MTLRLSDDVKPRPDTVPSPNTILTNINETSKRLSLPGGTRPRPAPDRPGPCPGRLDSVRYDVTSMIRHTRRGRRGHRMRV